MKILFVSAIMPYPLYSGGQVRVYNLLVRLAKKHDITLVTFLRSFDEKRYEKDLAFCKKIITGYRGHAWQPGYVLRTLAGTKPLLLTSYDHAGLREEIVAELSTGAYDLIHIEPWYVWPSIPKYTTPMVVATHNIEYPVYAEYVRRCQPRILWPGFFLDVVKLRHWEEYVWKQASHVVAVSDDDARVIGAVRLSKPNVSVVPNGVDVRSFRFQTKKAGTPPTFLFVGSFNWVQNRDAAAWLVTSIWPVLRKRYAGSTLRIVGRNAPTGLRRLIQSHEAILLEHVEDIQEELHRADIMIAPIRIGGGTSFKILEAMACGLPVVTTTLGAAGLKVAAGRELLIGDTADSITAAVRKLVDTPSMRFDLAKQARSCVERHYAWDTITKTMEDVWYETAKGIR